MSSLPRSDREPLGSPVARLPAGNRSDASLVEGAAAGDREALGVIWDRYSALVRGVLYGALGPDQAIEDLVQDVFLSLIRATARIQDGAALRGYLASMAVRQAAMEIRRRKVRRLVGLSLTGELPEQPVEDVDPAHREALRALHRVLATLSGRRRLAFILRHVQGLEMLETASALGISESTLRRELAVARELVSTLAAREPALSDILARNRGSWS